MKKTLSSLFFLLVVLILQGSFPTFSLASILFTDSFTDSNGTTLQTHNLAWISSVPGFSDLLIQNNHLLVPGGNNTAYLLNGFFGQTNQCASIDATFPLSSFIGITVRINQQRTSYYNFSIQPNGIQQLASQNGLLDTKIESINDGAHNLKICAINNYISTYIDSTKTLSAYDSTNLSGGTEFGTGNVGGTFLDNFLYTDGAELTDHQISVTMWKQTNPIWANSTYDHANLWRPQNPKISTWGCALTSAAMVLNYYNIVKLSNAVFLTPETLNNWLNSQKDGYVRNGEVNWLAISRLSKIAKASGYNPNFSYDALEFERQGSNSKDVLKDDLLNNQPDILQVPGHFVVATGTQNSTFTINDPYYDFDTLSTGFGDNYLALDRFIPSHTDLSYLFMVGENNLKLKLYDNNGNILNDSFTQEPMSNPNNPNQKNNELLSELLYKNPPSGGYKVSIEGTSNSLYQLDLYAYDQNGEPNIKTLKGFISPNYSETYIINFDKSNHGNFVITKSVTISTLYQDIQEAISLKRIDKGFGQSLLNQTKIIGDLLNKKNGVTQATIRLKTIQAELNITKQKLVQQSAYDILTNDISTLLATF